MQRMGRLVGRGVGQLLAGLAEGIRGAASVAPDKSVGKANGTLKDRKTFDVHVLPHEGCLDEGIDVGSRRIEAEDVNAAAEVRVGMLAAELFQKGLNSNGTFDVDVVAPDGIFKRRVLSVLMHKTEVC